MLIHSYMPHTRHVNEYKLRSSALWHRVVSDVVGYRRFGGPCCFRLQSEVSGAWIEIQVAVFCVVMCSEWCGRIPTFRSTMRCRSSGWQYRGSKVLRNVGTLHDITIQKTTTLNISLICNFYISLLLQWWVRSVVLPCNNSNLLSFRSLSSSCNFIFIFWQLCVGFLVEVKLLMS
jgi:hypothetical protein